MCNTFNYDKLKCHNSIFNIKLLKGDEFRSDHPMIESFWTK